MLPYRLLDCGDQKKVELFGEFKLVRPCPQALWSITKPELWNNVHSEFIRTSAEKGAWKPTVKTKSLPRSWEISSSNGLIWKIEPNEFGNVGVFTEHWTYADDMATFFGKNEKVLNLFTYSGSNCVSLVKAGFSVTVVDSSKNAMDTYNANLQLNKLARDNQRLILEDVYKFLSREVRREAKYGGIMMDAPSYGRGTKGEVFKIEDDLVKLLLACKQILLPDGKLVVTLHSPRFTPANLQILCQQLFPNKRVEAQEIIQTCESGIGLPSGFLVKIF